MLNQAEIGDFQMALAPRDAVEAAVHAVADMFSSQNITGVMLEEFDKDTSGNWLVTVGFDRPSPRMSLAIPSAMARDRKYKIVKLESTTGEVLSIKDRALEVR